MESPVITVGKENEEEKEANNSLGPGSSLHLMHCRRGGNDYLTIPGECSKSIVVERASTMEQGHTSVNWSGGGTRLTCQIHQG